MTDERQAGLQSDECPPSRRVDGKRHSWEFDGDSPVFVCHYCGQRRDAISGALLPARHPHEPRSLAMTDERQAGLPADALERVRYYARHDDSCSFTRSLADGSEKPCSCGFDEALAIWERALAAQVPAQPDIDRLTQALTAAWPLIQGNDDPADAAGLLWHELLTSTDPRQVSSSAAQVPAQEERLPDELGITVWPGGGGRVSSYDDGTWVNDGGGAWVLLYAPRQFYDGLRALGVESKEEGAG